VKRSDLTNIFKLILWLYFMNLALSLFTPDNYQVQTYIRDDIVELVILWVIPVLAVIVLAARRPENFSMLLKEWRIQLIGVGLLFLAGSAQKVSNIVFGSILARYTWPDSPFLPFTPTPERTAFAVVETFVFFLKYTGLAIVLAAIFRWTGWERIRTNRILLVLTILLCLVSLYMLYAEARSLLGIY
jgi:hypothetical protein